MKPSDDKNLMTTRPEDLPILMVTNGKRRLMTPEAIRSGLTRDEESGGYTFFDYMKRAMRIPHELLVEFTNLDQDERRDTARYMDFPPARSDRIWKKVTFE